MLLALLALPLVLKFQSNSVAQGAESVTAADVKKHIFVIANDSMMGRDTPSPGLEMTARYIAARFQAAGLKPGGDNGSYLQRYPVRRRRDTLPEVLVASTMSERVSGATTAPNVVGIIEGTDPVLKNEYVVFSAHMDHDGVRAGAREDSIMNGADDDASGTVGVIALAAAFSTAPPKRSLIFLTVSGEEKGLWGSDYFAGHPPVPIAQVVADLNMDMIGRNWRDTIVVIGKEHSDLGATLNRVNAAHAELGMHAIDDLWPQEYFYYRSDHFTFARRGVPVLFFFNGVHGDYHQPSDSPDKIDYEKESRIIKLVYYTGQEVANAAGRPQWNAESYRKIVQVKP
jgi:Zn-dependent M28 family amino/carboxypeptidase